MLAVMDEGYEKLTPTDYTDRLLFLFSHFDIVRLTHSAWGKTRKSDSSADSRNRNEHEVAEAIQSSILGVLRAVNGRRRLFLPSFSFLFQSIDFSRRICSVGTLPIETHGCS